MHAQAQTFADSIDFHIDYLILIVLLSLTQKHRSVKSTVGQDALD